MPYVYHIIIAHDAPVIQSVLRRLILRCYPTATVSLCAHGLAALQTFEHAGADLLLTDCHMPELDGPTLIRTLRGRRVSIPILGISGDPANEQELRQAGADAFMCGPISIPVFEQMVQTLLPSLATRARGAPNLQ
jgi:two-component system, NarL family, sensor histidine kinase EvgS